MLIVFLLLSVTINTSAQTQVYPVSVTTQVAPPYSVNLPDYASPGSDQLRVIIVQRDLTQSAYRLYLRMEIQLNGRIIIRTSPDYFPPAFTLDPGIPTVISGSDLSPYFDPVNMEFTGYSREEYIRTRMFPEGAYVITFTAYDFARRDVSLSHGGAFFCYLAKSEPPILNLPINNSAIAFTTPQSIRFQWLPRTVSSPNSAFSTRYRLELYEMRTGGMSPGEIVNATRPVFVTETDRTSFPYSINEPQLENGMRYVWRVRAFDVDGRDYIRNEGYSEVFSFDYGESNKSFDYNSIQNFVATAVSPRKAKLSWDDSPGYQSYKVFYRKEGNGSRWYETETNGTEIEISGLSPGEIYECRLQGKAKNTLSSLSEVDTVQMPKIPVIDCGSPFLPLVTSNRDPLTELMRLQEFDAGGFTVTVTDPYAITTKPGVFSGRGFVQVPLFSHKKIRCVFTEVFINTDFQMVQGIVRLLTDDTPGGDNAVWDTDEIFEGGTGNGSVIQGTEEAAITLPDVTISKPENIVLDTARREIILITMSGDTAKVDISEALKDNPPTLTIKDAEGNLYTVETGSGKSAYIGQAAPAGSQQQSVSLSQVLDNRKGIVRFENAKDATYAFDTKDQKYQRSNLFTEEYRTIKLYDGSEYNVPFKLIPVGETDRVLATFEKTGNSVKPDSIIFRSGTGTIYKPELLKTQKSGKITQYVLTLPSGKDNDGIDIFAVYTDSKGQTFVLGKMTVISYEVKRPELVLVPVNGNTSGIDIATVKKQLDEVYHPVAVDWQVTLDRSDFTYVSDSLNITGSGLWSRYTEGMKRINNEFVMHLKESFNPAAVYLFLLKSSDESSATGDMPRSKQFGYVFTETAREGGKEALYRTISHEVAHGMFHLSHTFDNQYQIPRGSTGNLLDYTAGTDLVKHQWDAIHAPGIVLGMFERDEDGAMKIPVTKFIDYMDLGIDFSGFTCDIPNKLTFITPAGYPFVLPKNYKFCFSGTTTKAEIDNIVPPGVLTAFKDDKDITYVSTFVNIEGKWKFSGYTKKNSSKEKYSFPESEVRSLPDPAKVILGIENEQDCKIDIAFIKFSGDYKNLDYSVSHEVEKAFNYSKYQFSITSSYGIETCRLPAKISALTKANCTDLFASEVWVRYNIYGDEGVLIKYNIDGVDYYVYSNIDGQGNSYYYTYDDLIGKWRNYVPPKAEGLLNSLGFLFNPQVLGKVAKDEGHTALDIMGLIPVVGEVFDAANGLFYLIEKEEGQAALCFASTLPVAGWAWFGGKYVWKGAKKYGKAVKSISGFQFVKISDDAIDKITSKINDLKLETRSAEGLAADLKASPELVQKLADNPDLIESWKILENNLILRRQFKNLESIQKWINGGVDKEKLFEGISKSESKQKLIDAINNAKSKLHVQVLIKDYDNIPGVAKGRYISNSSTMADKADLPTGWTKEHDINERTVETFTGKIEPLELKPGDKIYRVSRADGSSGTYWTRTKPPKLDDVVGGTAVQPEWNNFEYIFEYTVPDGVTIKTWKGKAARQAVSESIPSNYHLPGGDEQLFINYISKQDPNFDSFVKSTKTTW